MKKVIKEAFGDPWFWCCTVMSGAVVYFWQWELAGFLSILFVKFIIIPMDMYLESQGGSFLDLGLLDELLSAVIWGDWEKTSDPLIAIVQFFLRIILGVVAIVVGLASLVIAGGFFLIVTILLMIGEGIYKLNQVSPAGLFLWYGCLVFLIGFFLYGFLFPVVYKIIEPILAFTVGEVVYQKYQKKFSGGEKPRSLQPFYLGIAVIFLSLALVRVASPFFIKENFSMEKADVIFKKYVEEKKAKKYQESEESIKARTSFGKPFRGSLSLKRGDYCVYRLPELASGCIVTYIVKIPGPEKGLRRFKNKEGDWYLIYAGDRYGWIRG